MGNDCRNRKIRLVDAWITEFQIPNSDWWRRKGIKVTVNTLMLFSFYSIDRIKKPTIEVGDVEPVNGIEPLCLVYETSVIAIIRYGLKKELLIGIEPISPHYQ